MLIINRSYFGSANCFRRATACIYLLAMAAAMKAMKSMKAMKAMRAKTAMKKATKAKKAKTAMKAKDNGMRASFRKTKLWSAMWMGMYYKWELVDLKWDKGNVLETWNATLRPGWKKVNSENTLQAMVLGDEKALKAKAMKATKAKAMAKTKAMKTKAKVKAMKAMKAKKLAKVITMKAMKAQK